MFARPAHSCTSYQTSLFAMNSSISTAFNHPSHLLSTVTHCILSIRLLSYWSNVMPSTILSYIHIYASSCHILFTSVRKVRTTPIFSEAWQRNSHLIEPHRQSSLLRNPLFSSSSSLVILPIMRCSPTASCILQCMRSVTVAWPCHCSSVVMNHSANRYPKAASFKSHWCSLYFVCGLGSNSVRFIII